MPYEVRCTRCDTTNAVRTREQADEWHGSHPTVVIAELDGLGFGAVKRKRRGQHRTPSTKPTHDGDCAKPQGGTCPLCGEDYDLFLRDHLPCDE